MTYPSHRQSVFVRSFSGTLGALLLGITMVGCKYSTERPFRTDIRTIHVEIAQSRDFRRNLEFDLSEALVKRIEMDTPYRVSRKAYADSVLSCEIIEVRNRGFADDFTTERPREVASNIYFRYRWKDVRSGEIIAERPRMVYTTAYLPSAGETFDTATIRSMNGLAERIVETMESPW